MTLIVSAASPADAPELAEVAAATFPLACPPSVPPDDVAAFIAEHLSEQCFAGYLLDPDRQVLTARADGPILGPRARGPILGPRARGPILGYAMLVAGTGSDPAVAAAVPERPAVELSKMYVRAGHHGTGASAALMAAALAAAARTGAACVWLGVNRNNERAQRFYRKNGFVVAGERRFAVGRGLEHDFIMVHGR